MPMYPPEQTNTSGGEAFLSSSIGRNTTHRLTLNSISEHIFSASHPPQKHCSSGRRCSCSLPRVLGCSETNSLSGDATPAARSRSRPPPAKLDQKRKKSATPTTGASATNSVARPPLTVVSPRQKKAPASLLFTVRPHPTGMVMPILPLISDMEENLQAKRVAVGAPLFRHAGRVIAVFELP